MCVYKLVKGIWLVPSIRELETWLTPIEASREIGISRQSLYRYLEEGKLRAAHTRAGWIIEPTEVERMKNAWEVDPAKFKELRLEAGLTHEELADQAGVGTAIIQRLEAGEGEESYKHVALLAHALGVRPQGLRKGLDQ